MKKILPGLDDFSSENIRGQQPGQKNQSQKGNDTEAGNIKIEFALQVAGEDAVQRNKKRLQNQISPPHGGQDKETGNEVLADKRTYF